MPETTTPNHMPEEKHTLILTGASRGIGHATVKRFSSAGWRVITCSRHAFPENCPWAAGPEDHIQVFGSPRMAWLAQSKASAFRLAVSRLVKPCVKMESVVLVSVNLQQYQNIKALHA